MNTSEKRLSKIKISILAMICLGLVGTLVYQSLPDNKVLLPKLNQQSVKNMATIRGYRYPYSFSYPSFFIVQRDPAGNYPSQEIVVLINRDNNSAVKRVEFRCAEGYYPTHPQDQTVVNGNTLWYANFPEYPDGGQVLVIAEKEKQLIFEFRFYGVADFNDPVIQSVFSGFKML